MIEVESNFGEVTQEKPTSYLRWSGPVLEQEWEIFKYVDGKPVSRREEWRPIPSVNGSEDNG